MFVYTVGIHKTNCILKTLIRISVKNWALIARIFPVGNQRFFTYETRCVIKLALKKKKNEKPAHESAFVSYMYARRRYAKPDGDSYFSVSYVIYGKKYFSMTWLWKNYNNLKQIFSDVINVCHVRISKFSFVKVKLLSFL